MDGNGRWAERRGLPRLMGHQAGERALRRVVKAAPALGIKVLTVYAFSADNWKRPEREVSGLMALLEFHLRQETKRCQQEGVRVQVIGRRDRLQPSILAAMERIEQLTSACQRLHLRLAIDYSSREFLLNAWRRHATECLDSSSFSSELGIPDVDLLIRTGGEQRLSDFLLWESAYAELYFTDCMWPDFGEEELAEAIRAFHRRDRRFGAVPQVATA